MKIISKDRNYEVEANITLCSQVHASNKKEAIRLAIEDILEGIYDTQILPEDCKIIHTSNI